MSPLKVLLTGASSGIGKRLAERLVAEGWTPYLLTFMYDHMRGSDINVGLKMEKEVERVYATHLTRVVRKPTAPCSFGRLPVWLCSPDRPVFKYAKQSRLDVQVNEGRHMHAAAFDPPWSRLDVDLATHFDRCRDLYLRPGHPLIRIDVQPITHRTGYVVGYARKHIGRGFVGQDATLILPRSISEIRSAGA